MTRWMIGAYATCWLASAGCAQDWVELSDEAFAKQHADQAFGTSLEDRQRIAWKIFARVNQLVDDPGRGMSERGKVPLWMTWPTDPDTFGTNRPFEFGSKPRGAMRPSAEKKDLESGRVATAFPDGSNEEVTRNKISYDYLIQNGLTTKIDVAAFFEKNDFVNMPVGSIELKASWLQVTKGSPAPPGALTFDFGEGQDKQKYWWRGLHLMVKMRLLREPGNAFYSEDPSWFWSTFQFTDLPGVRNVRNGLITQSAPLQKDEIAKILDDAGIGGFGFDRYSPNGTQIRFTVGGTGTTPVILGHTDMEDFAGTPNNAQPRYWKGFESSCHSCHATAAYSPHKNVFFPFSVPTGALDPSYNFADKAGTVQYLGQGYRSLDFMWPIVFQAR